MAGAPVRQQPSSAARRGETAFERHSRLVSAAISFYGERLPEAPAPRAAKTDQDALRETFRFIREEKDDEGSGREVGLARRYYSKLFREYCIADLSRYKEGKVGMRWRTQKEVVSGKGQFVCGAKGCENRAGLASYEVNLGYVEAGMQKNALVKLRVCPEHALQLNHKKDAAVLKEQAKRRRKELKRFSKRKKAARSSHSSEDGHLLQSADDIDDLPAEEPDVAAAPAADNIKGGQRNSGIAGSDAEDFLSSLLP